MPVLQKTAFWEMTLGRLQEGMAPILKFFISGLLGSYRQYMMTLQAMHKVIFKEPMPGRKC